MSGIDLTLGKTVGANEPDSIVEYVESDGSQVIDTGVTPGPTGYTSPAITSMKVDADLDWISGTVMVGSTYHNFEPLKSFNSKIGGFVKNSGNTETAYALNSGRHRVVTTAVQGQNLTIDVDGVTTTSSGSVVANNSLRTLYVFASNNGTAAGSDHSTARLYGLKIYINGALVRDFVPGVKNGVAGLYDRQNDKWYASKSGTALIAGPVFTPTSPTPTEFPTSQQTVTLECATAGATIYYTTDGSDPTTSSAVYSAPFTVTGGTTVKARAYMTGLPESAIFSATFTHEVSLTHRWSFNGDLADSVGGATATTIGTSSTVNYIDGAAVQTGSDQAGTYATALNLGTGLVTGSPITIEIWATRRSLTTDMRLFDWGLDTRDYLCLSWNDTANAWARSGNADRNNPTNTISGCWADNVKYYVAARFAANGDGSTTLHLVRYNTADFSDVKTLDTTFADCNLANIIAGNLYLGHSQWPDESGIDAKAIYDEVRIWNGIVGDDQLAANASMGPDVYTSGLEEGFTLADNAVFNVPADGYVASGTVTLGAGSKLRFDTSSMQWDDTVSFSATGFNVPSGSILDYVEPQGSANFSVTLSGNTITVTRLRQNKPDAYLEYVQSTGSQWIDTGVCPNANMTIDADVDLMGNGIFMGVSHYESYPIECKDGYIAGRLLRSNYATTTVVTNTGRHRVVASATGTSKRFTISVDGSAVVNSTGNVSVSSAGATMYVFQGQYAGSTTCTAKLYSLNISTNGVMARQFVPGIKNYVAGLYDTLNDVWYASQSGTELIPGPVKERHNEPQVQIDYVKSTGAQWVETNFMPSRTMTVEADLDWVSGAVLAQNHYDIRVLSPKDGCIAGSTYSWSSYATTDVPLDSGRHHVVVKSVNGQKLTVSVDGAAPEEAGSASSRDCTPPSLYIFAAHNGGGTGSYMDAATAKLYGLKMYDSNGILKRDFVPGIKDNVVGLYDRVSDIFYSSGSGTPLVAGPAVERSKPDAFVEYVESNGSQWVDTGVDGRAGVKSEADIDWISGAPLGVIGNSHCLLLQDLSGIGGQARGSGEVKTGVAVNSGRHLIVSEVGNDSKMTVTVDGTTSATSANNASGSTGVTIWMFAAHNYNNGGAWGAARSKFYGLKLWQTGSDGICRLQRHFIPCVKDSRAGLYDAVSGVIFYSHSGTDLSASSTEVPLAVWRNESDDASLDNAANWCGDLQNATDTVLCAPWLTSVSSANGFAVSNLTVTGGNLAFADGTNTVAGTLSADGALAFTNLVVNGSADCTVAISGFISGHGTVTSLTLAEGARFAPDGAGYLTVTDALAGTMLIDMTDVNLSGVKGRFPLFKTGTVDILPAVSSVEFVGGRPPSGRNLINVKSGFGYDLTAGNFMILLR